MENKFSTMLNFFNKPVNQADAFKQVSFTDTKVGEIVFKDVKDEPNLTKMPIAKITRTIGLTPSSKASGEFEPIGSDETSIEFIEPLYQNTIQNIGVDEMEFYNSMWQSSGAQQFLNDKAEITMEAYFKYVNNMKNQSLTSIITQQVRNAVTNDIFTGKTLNYGTIIGAHDTADDSASFDISSATMTREQFWNYLDRLRYTKNLSTNGSRFINATDCDILFDPTIFSYAIGLATGQQDGNLFKMIQNIATGAFEFGGFKLWNLAAPFSTFVKGTKDKWAAVEQNAVAAKYIKMIDTVNGKHMQRNLKVVTNDGLNAGNFYMEIIPKPIKTQGWELVFSAKPLVVLDTTAMLTRKIDT